MTKQANVRGILGELTSLLSDTARDFALYTLAIGGLTAVGVLAGLTDTAAGQLDYGFSIDADDPSPGGLFDFVSTVVGVFATYLLLTRFLAARGRLRAGGSRFWPYIGMAIVSTIAVILGFVMLIVPGIFLLVRWSAASGFLIGARESVSGSLGASWEATEGHGWAIFFSAVILFVGTVVAAALVGAVLELADGPLADVASAFLEAAAGGVFAAFGIAIYCRVHHDAHEISEVFA